MAQGVKVLVAQGWQREFYPWNSRWKEKTAPRSCPLASMCMLHRITGFFRTLPRSFFSLQVLQDWNNDYILEQYKVSFIFLFFHILSGTFFAVMFESTCHTSLLMVQLHGHPEELVPLWGWYWHSPKSPQWRDWMEITCYNIDSCQPQHCSDCPSMSWVRQEGLQSGAFWTAVESPLLSLAQSVSSLSWPLCAASRILKAKSLMKLPSLPSVHSWVTLGFLCTLWLCWLLFQCQSPNQRL